MITLLETSVQSELIVTVNYHISVILDMGWSFLGCSEKPVSKDNPLRHSASVDFYDAHIP